MDDLENILAAIADGDPEASVRLLPVVYQELRDLAARRMRREPPGQTLQATALVHEAYLRLFEGDARRSWSDRVHFFKAASEAMRRILIENARRKKRLKHGGGRRRVEFVSDVVAVESSVDDMLEFDAALEELGRVDPQAAELVEYRYFSGLSTEGAAELMNLPPRTAYRTWAFAKAWLYRRLHPGTDPPPP